MTQALGMIHAALNQRSASDPEHSERSFAISMTDIGETYFLPALMDLLRKQAPGVGITTHRNTGNLRDEMEVQEIVSTWRAFS